MDHLDSNVYYGLKNSLRKAAQNIAEGNLPWGELPVILVDFHNWEVSYFEDEDDAEEQIEKRHGTWDKTPPKGEDKELIVLKFCTEISKHTHKRLYEDFKFWKEINGTKYYKRKSYVEFEQELIIRAHI